MEGRLGAGRMQTSGQMNDGMGNAVRKRGTAFI